MSKAGIKDSTKEKQSSRLSPQTLRIQLQVREFAQSEGRKHWDLFRHLFNPFVLYDALNKLSVIMVPRASTLYRSQVLKTTNGNLLTNWLAN